MKLFMNAKGQYLKFWRAEKCGYVAGSEWRYCWVDDINKATVKLFIPSNSIDKWQYNDNPKSQVIAELDATVEETRIVTLC